MALSPSLLSGVGFACTVFFLSLSLVLPHEAHWLAAAAACHFLPKAGNGKRLLSIFAFFFLLALFNWGILFAGVLLFAALLAEIWVGSTPLKKSAGFLMAALSMMALLFCAIPGISVYVDAVSAPLPLLAPLLAGGVLLEFLVSRQQAERPVLDPLLIVLLAVLTLCYVLAVALLATSIAYPQAILLAALGGCLMLIAIAFFSASFMGGSALGFFQHILSLHVPVEKWVTEISAAAAQEENSEAFADAVMRRFLSLPAVVGVTWRLGDGSEQRAGAEGKYQVALQAPPLFLRLAMRRRASPWDWFNYYLLARISGEYCRAKQREEQHRADNLSRAVHEAGARLTHDIKNILHTVSALAQTDDDALVRRQLPALRERLETTLTKLNTPAAEADIRISPAAEWWAAAQARYLHQPVHFAAAQHSAAGAAAAGAAADGLPALLFDLALDNFISNALIKRQLDSTVTIHARLLSIKGQPALEVEDSGMAVADAIAPQLFRRPVESATGFGVALYQVQQEAAKHGYTAALAGNASGRVLFQVAATPPPAPPAAR